MLALVAIMAILLAWGLVAGRLARWSVTAPIAMVVAGHRAHGRLQPRLRPRPRHGLGGAGRGGRARRPALRGRHRGAGRDVGGAPEAHPAAAAHRPAAGPRRRRPHRGTGLPVRELLAAGRHGDHRHADRPRPGRRRDPRPPGARAGCATCSTSRAATTTEPSRRSSCSASRPPTPTRAVLPTSARCSPPYPPCSWPSPWAPRSAGRRAGCSSRRTRGSGPSRQRSGWPCWPCRSWPTGWPTSGAATGSWPPSWPGSSSRRRPGTSPPTPCTSAEDTGTLLGPVHLVHLRAAHHRDPLRRHLVGHRVYALLVISVARVLPVMLSLVRTDVPIVDRLFLGWVGPRGLASIVFGLLAYIGLSPPENDFVGEVMVITVLMSVVLHGLSYGPIVARLRPATGTVNDGPSPADTGGHRGHRDTGPARPTEPGLPAWTRRRRPVSGGRAPGSRARWPRCRPAAGGRSWSRGPRSSRATGRSSPAAGRWRRAR